MIGNNQAGSNPLTTSIMATPVVQNASPAAMQAAAAGVTKGVQIGPFVLGRAAPLTTADRIRPPGAPLVHGRKRHQILTRNFVWLGRQAKNKFRYRGKALATYGFTLVLLAGYIFDWKLVTDKIPLYNYIKEKYPEPTENL